MIDFLLDFLTPGDISVIVGVLIALVILGMCWWEFYAKPCRDSLRNIELALKAAPWMQQRNNQGLKRSA